MLYPTVTEEIDGINFVEGMKYFHMLPNGKTAFEVIDIEVLNRPADPATAAIGPVAAENPSARVYRWELAPGASTLQHTHERPYVIISATAMDLGVKAPDGNSMDHVVKAGDFH